MTDAGFFKGTSAEQDARFADKKKKLMKTMKFGDNLSQKVDMTRINLDCIRPWVINRVTELLNFEDEVVCNYVLNQLEERHPDPKEIQINITGFLNSKNARVFLTELWDLLLSAMDNPDGVPTAFLEAKKTEILKRQEEEQRFQLELRRKEEELRTRTSARVPTSTSIQAQPSGQGILDSSSNTANIESSSRKKSERNSGSRRSQSSSSPSPRRHHSPRRDDKPREPERAIHNHSSRHRRQSTRSSSRSSGADRGHRKRSIREVRHQRRSVSHESPERSVKKRPAPDSDWRKDLMAGRRRSPPEMPENSYYGYEKRPKDRKHSRERHRDHRRRDTSESRRNSPVVEYSDDHRRRKHRELTRDDYESDTDDRRRRRHRERFRESRSPSLRKAVDDRDVERTNKYHNRRAQWAQEEDDLVVKQENSRGSRRIVKSIIEASDKHARRSPEGPSLPPSRVPSRTAEKGTKLRSTTSSTSASDDEIGSSSSSGESTYSSSDGSKSSEDEPSAAETSSEKLSFERPTLQSVVIAEPEGPALPPASDEGPEWTDDVNADRSDSSTSSSSDSQDSEEASESSDTDSSSSESSDESEKERSISTKSRKPILDNPRDLQSRKRRASPEGPALPPNLHNDHNRRREESEVSRKKSRDEVRCADERDETAEEALRRRALASLIRASGDRRRPNPRSP